MTLIIGAILESRIVYDCWCGIFWHSAVDVVADGRPRYLTPKDGDEKRGNFAS